MTAREALLERVGQLSEEDAAEWLARMEWESTEFEELTAEEWELVKDAEEEIARGETVPAEEVYRELGL
jgi:hypothetical protein